MTSADHKDQMDHQKHAKLNRPAIGNYGRNEVALLGTPCGKIKQLAGKLVEALREEHWNVAFVDADHKAAETQQTGLLNFTDKISYRRFDYLSQPNNYQVKKYFNECDAIIVNGNHFKAAHQILIIDPKKPLDRKLERITHPLMVILTEGVEQIPEYLLHLTEGLPVFQWIEQRGPVQFLSSWVESRRPNIKGLVLAGGRSQRMQQDKGSLNYHGRSQRAHLFDQMTDRGITTWVSCRADQVKSLEDDLPLLPDSFIDLGPMGALLTAFRHDPDAAWLAVACDLPYLTVETLDYLIANRDASKQATAFQSPFDEFPEPLITIWEPKSYLTLFEFLSQGYSCPRKALINSNIALLNAPRPKDLSNINHPHEYQEAIKDLQ